jgi:hypothetical protein
VPVTVTRLQVAALAGAATLVFALGVAFLAAADFVRSFGPILPPPIPGATAEEQASELVRRAFTTGRVYRTGLDSVTGDSWLEAARQAESGTPWAEVKAAWLDRDRAARDAAFARAIMPEIEPYLRDPSPIRRHQAVLFLRSFAAGLKDRR